MKFTALLVAIVGAVAVSAAPIEAIPAAPATTSTGPKGLCFYFGGSNCGGFPWKA